METVNIKNDQDRGLQPYFKQKCEAMEISVRDGQQNLLRLEAQRNVLNAKGCSSFDSSFDFSSSFVSSEFWFFWFFAFPINRDRKARFSRDRKREWFVREREGSNNAFIFDHDYDFLSSFFSSNDERDLEILRFWDFEISSFDEDTETFSRRWWIFVSVVTVKAIVRVVKILKSRGRRARAFVIRVHLSREERVSSIFVLWFLFYARARFVFNADFSLSLFSLIYTCVW